MQVLKLKTVKMALRMRLDKQLTINNVQLIKIILIIFIPILMASSCKIKREESSAEGTSTEKTIAKPEFSADSAYLFT